MTQISIITPAYIDTPEKADWLKETVQSVQAQDFTDWEMIVVDDASPLALDLPDDPRVRVVRAAQNSKPSLCRNTAAALARSECLLPLDADDRLPAGTLRVMFELWNEDRKRVVYGDMQRLEPQESGGYDLGKEVKFPPYEFQRTLDFRGTIPVTAMHSKEAHTRAGGWKEEFDAGLEDVEYWISCGLAGFCGYHIDHVTLYYRRSQQNRSWHMRRTNQREGMMRNIIYQMHENIYEGRDYPMSCCGGKGGVRVNRGVANQRAGTRCGSNTRANARPPSGCGVAIRASRTPSAARATSLKSTYRTCPSSGAAGGGRIFGLAWLRRRIGSCRKRPRPG
jgi:glycosyltransferase involved in cell wall biosynthesis